MDNPYLQTLLTFFLTGVLLSGWYYARIDPEKKKSCFIGCLLYLAIGNLIGWGLLLSGQFNEDESRGNTDNRREATETIPNEGE